MGSRRGWRERDRIIRRHRLNGSRRGLVGDLVEPMSDGVTGAAYVQPTIRRAEYTYSLGVGSYRAQYMTPAQLLELFSDNPARRYIRFEHDNGSVLELMREG